MLFYNITTNVSKGEKMKSAIEQVFGGELANQNPDMGKEYWELNSVAIQKEKALRELINNNAEAVKAFDDYINAEGDVSGEEAIAFYKQGFRNGFWLAFDLMNEE